MTKFLTMVLLSVCLVQVDKVTVPSRDTHYKDLRFVTYNAKKREFVDYGMKNETWCESSTNSLARDLCSRPNYIPAEEKLIFSLREDLFKEENWRYLVAGTIYIEQARRPSRQKDASGKTRYVFDCNALPFIPSGMKIVMHTGGQFEWDPHRVKLHSPQGCRDGELVRGYDFLRELAGQKTLNGTALEYLLSSPFLIPRTWYGQQVLFLGTIYENRSQTLYGNILL